MIKSRTHEDEPLSAAAQKKFDLVSAALLQILVEGQVYAIDVSLVNQNVVGKIHVTIDGHGNPELNVTIY